MSCGIGAFDKYTSPCCRMASDGSPSFGYGLQQLWGSGMSSRISLMDFSKKGGAVQTYYDLSLELPGFVPLGVMPAPNLHGSSLLPYDLTSPITTFQHYIYFNVQLERPPGVTSQPAPILACHLSCILL